MKIFAILGALAVSGIASAQLTQPVGFGEAVVVERNSPGLVPSIKFDYINLYDNDLSFLKTLGTFPLLRAPGAVTFASSGDIYLAEWCDPAPCTQIQRYQQSGAVTPFAGTFHDSVEAMQFIANGDLVVSFSGNVSLVDANGSLNRTLAVSIDPIFAFDVDRDQCTLVFSTVRALLMTSICSVNPETQILPFLTGGAFFGVRFLPNGNILTGSRGLVFEVDRRGGTVHRFVTWDADYGEVAIDPDEKSFWTSAGNRLFRFDLSTGDVIAGPIALRNAAYGARSMAVRGEWRAALHPALRRRSAGL